MLRISFIGNQLTVPLAVFAIGVCINQVSYARASSNDGAAIIQPATAEMLGPDLDSDGIRDDFQKHLEKTYAGDQEKLHRALEKARIDHKVLASFHNAKKMHSLAAEQFRATQCWLREFTGTSRERKIALADYNYYFYSGSRILVQSQIERQAQLALVNVQVNFFGEDYCK